MKMCINENVQTVLSLWGEQWCYALALRTVLEYRDGVMQLWSRVAKTG